MNCLSFLQDLANCLKGCRFLPKVNIDLVDYRNSTYKERFANLQNLVLIMTELYTKDWIGLKTLDEAGKVKFINVSRNHLQISLADMQKYIVPYLVDDAALANKMATRMASSSWTPWVQGLYRRMLRRRLVRLFEDWPLLLAVTFSFCLKM
ncbi:uncharacterized protein LOC130137630 [Syzygium oleosum]|uniref:uncharacterized protein LOC130137630 n=1 Tax=Syzygium oleosum TaxID=219896 RepID=UPI0024BAF58D|nr:uncharacterized protein LOC130137630 [Syzygium oleosum]